MHDERHHSLFLRNGFRYAVPIGLVREVFLVQRVLPSPVPRVGFVGFLNFRQELCPVLDLSAWMEGQVPPSVTGPCLVIVLGQGDEVAAFLIDRYLESAVLEGPAETANEVVVDLVYPRAGEAVHRLAPKVLLEWIRSHRNDLLPHHQKQGGLDVPTVAEADLIGFSLGGLTCALPIGELVEVIEGYTVEPLFQVDASLRGLINLRGQILACVDLSEAFGVPPRKLEEKNQFLVLREAGVDLALCIDAVSHKLRVPVSSIVAPGEVLKGELADYLGGIIETPGERILVLSGPSIFASRHFAAYRE